MHFKTGFTNHELACVKNDNSLRWQHRTKLIKLCAVVYVLKIIAGALVMGVLATYICANLTVL